MSAPTTTIAGKAGLHVRYEKAGLILDALPVPFNADAVIVEANVRLPKKTPRLKQDFTLRWSAEEPGLPAELLVEQTPKTPMRVFFRVPKPKETSIASVHWREHLLGQVEVPILAMSGIVNGFTIEMPTVSIAFWDHTVACQAFMSAQAKAIFASAILRCASLLAPAQDLALRVQVKREKDGEMDRVPIVLTADQLAKRQTLASVRLPRPRTLGNYDVSWWIASRCLHAQRVRVVSKKTMLRSLRITSARFHLEMLDGTSHTVRTLPMRNERLCLEGIAKVTPRFFVCSNEGGMAALAPFTLRALVGDTIRTLAKEDEVLVTDGPRLVAFAALRADEMIDIKHFTLATGDTILGNLALLPAPSASFNSEGGFAPLDDFLWSPAADEQFKDRLGKLLDEE